MSLTLTLLEPFQACLHAESLRDDLPGVTAQDSLEEAQAIREGWTEAEVRAEFRRKYHLDF